MYELNGIMYAGETTPELKVTDARVTNDWMMLVTFSNGETRVFDGTRLWDKPVYEPLRNQATFDDFAIDHGILTWERGNIDIGTDNLYDMCYPYDTITSGGSRIICCGADPCLSAQSETHSLRSKRENPASLAGAGFERYVLDSDELSSESTDQRACLEGELAFRYIVLTAWDNIWAHSTPSVLSSKIQNQFPGSVDAKCLGTLTPLSFETRVALASLLPPRTYPST